MIKLALSILLLSLNTYAVSTNTKVAAEASEYLKNHPDEKILIDDLFAKVPTTKVGVIPVQKIGAPVLFVHGIDKIPYYPEWVLPLGLTIKKKMSVSFFTWEPKDGIRDAAKVLSVSLEGILRLYPNEKLTVFAHSAGGIPALMALGSLAPEYQKRIALHTIASPIYGYKAPKISLIASPIFGKSNIEVGHGFKKEMRKLKLTQCQHWITTNCKLDKHACSKLGNLPQTGSTKETEVLPCGNENVKKLSDDDHESAVYHVVKKVLK